MRAKRAAMILGATLLAGIPAEAYYHYVYYVATDISQYTGRTLVPVKFDVTRLPGNTVTFYVTDSGPSVFAPGDTFGSLLGQVKQALAAWNAVPTSALRIAFGGLESANQNANTPGGQVVFQDLGPGLLGLGTPSISGTPNFQNNGQGLLIPINRSLVILSNNTSMGPGPSYLESYFTTAVHEIGHALGLQHTWTGSAMSQSVIRNTSRARPLDADDIASLSELYGTANWTANYGSISGTVRFNNNQPVSLASVVAISPTGPAISALTNPDGTYTINGLPPNNYQLYVHPLPPDGVVAGGEGVLLPQNQFGIPIPASQSFRSIFLGGGVDPNSTRTFAVNPGSSFTGQDFTVVPRAGVPAYDLVTMSYLDPVSVNYTTTPGGSWVNPSPAFLNTNQPQGLVYARSNDGSVTRPTAVTMLGIGSANVRTNSDPGVFLYFNMPPGQTGGPRHLVFNYGNDMYVLPNGVNLVQQGPPSISSVAATAENALTVTGAGIGPDSRVFFDGLPAAGSYNGPGSITVTPPAASSGQTSTITVFASDSQNSMFPLGIGQFTSSNFQQQNPQTYTYPSSFSPQIQSISPAALPAGFSNVPYTSMVDITAVNTKFVDGQVTVGFGTNDISVSRVWVLSPTHLIANVVVASGAAVGTSEISVISGFNVLTAPVQFQVQPANPSAALLAATVNAVTNQATLQPGGFGVIYGLNLPANQATVQASLNGVPLFIQYAGANQINFVVPATTLIGGATLTLNTPNGPISTAVQVGNSPVIIQGLNGQPISVAAPLAVALFNPGDTVTLQVNGLDSSVAANLTRVQVTVSGLPMPVIQAGNGQVQFALTQSFGGAQVPVVVSVDGSPSAAFTIAVK